ncbi:hypothetical protein HDV00_009383 [Rhizophlyctis rosea]|nr:hypothetical protein HDV00_009383 [Rhizophlyctis rosea]
MVHHLLSSFLLATFFLLSFSSPTIAQTDATVQPTPQHFPSKCLILTPDTPCGPAFAGWPMPAREYPTVSNFTTHIQKTWGGTPTQVKAFNRYHGCKNTTSPTQLRTLRYQLSRWCTIQTLATITTIKECQEPEGKEADELRPCQEPCELAWKTLEAFFESPECGGGEEGRERRTRTIDRLKRGCAMWREREFDDVHVIRVENAWQMNEVAERIRKYGDGKGCLPGVGEEAENCGVDPSLSSIMLVAAQLIVAPPNHKLVLSPTQSEEDFDLMGEAY